MGQYDNTGPLTPFDRMGSIVQPVYGIALNAFINRTPLYTRLPQVPLGAMTFATSTVLFRPSTGTLNNGGTLTNVATTVPVLDGSVYQSGDTIDIDSETMLITAISGNNLTVTRGYAGTANVTHADASIVWLISNTRTGAEINVNGISRIPIVLLQNSQTFQHPYQVGGALASATEYALPPGVTSVVGRERMMAIQNCSDDMERAFYYGRPVSLNPAAPGGSGAGAATKPMMAGLRTQIVTHHVVAPTNFASYKPSDFIRDVTQGPTSDGGALDVALVSTDWQFGFAQWQMPLIRITDAMTTEFGVQMDVFEVPFLNGLRIIPAPLLRPGTVIGLSSAEVRNRVKREMFDKPRGSQGDAEQGDILAEGALELDNESHHSMVEGVTGWVPE